MKELPELSKPADAVMRILQGRIESGEALLAKTRGLSHPGAESSDSSLRGELDNLDGEFRAWDRYNEIVLRGAFTGEEISRRYNHSKPLFMVNTTAERLRAFDRRLSGALVELRSIVGIIELLDVSSKEPTVASSGADRDRYFQRLCELVGGRVDKSVQSETIGRDLGMSKDTRSDVETYLSAEGLIEFVAFGPKVGLTHTGRLRYEHGTGTSAVPAAASQSITIIGNVSGSVQQGATGATQNAQVTVSSIEPARQWIAELIARIEDGTLQFDPDALVEVNEYVAALSDEFESAAPKKSVMRMGIRSLGRMLEEAGGSMIAQGLLTAVPIVVEALA